VHEKRTSVRHEVKISATVVIGGEAHQVELHNLSLGGASVVYSERVPTGERVTVTFSVATHDKPIEVGGSVRWASADALGIQFDGLRAREVWSLNKYFDSLEE